ncbi:hypothetical protein H0E87_004254 [Populus deltoides]|uniref:Pentatricopeptide repeat-containing protein n=1 Tax=Populus deltoides TaxID=3696 RepID=A0A8T2ZEG8_POPDE|nr:hypothetical protein H0E87_004254 [Populus deltoides]
MEAARLLLRAHATVISLSEWFCEEALDAFGKMQNRGYRPDGSYSCGVLSALYPVESTWMLAGRIQDAYHLIKSGEDVCSSVSSVDSGNDPHYALLLNHMLVLVAEEKLGREQFHI